MNKEYETSIVKSFFSKRIQDRMLFELQSSKKRINALSRLCHNFQGTTIDERYLVEIPEPNSDYKKILSLMKEYSAGDKCYAISFNQEIDGKIIPLTYALEKAVGFGMPSIIYCPLNKLAYFESEQISGPPQRYILIKK